MTLFKTATIKTIVTFTELYNYHYSQVYSIIKGFDCNYEYACPRQCDFR